MDIMHHPGNAAMLLIARGQRLKLTVGPDWPTPSRWEAWPKLAELEVSADRRSAVATLAKGKLGDGKFAVMAHRLDGEPAARFEVRAIAPGEVTVERAPLKSRIGSSHMGAR